MRTANKMKKALLLIAVTVVVTSCSKDWEPSRDGTPMFSAIKPPAMPVDSTLYNTMKPGEGTEGTPLY